MIEKFVQLNEEVNKEFLSLPKNFSKFGMAFASNDLCSLETLTDLINKSQKRIISLKKELNKIAEKEIMGVLN